VTATYCVCLFLDMSAFSLLMAVFFARQMIGSDFSTANLQKSSARSERPGMGERMKGNLFSLRWARFASVIATLILFGKGAAFAAPVQEAKPI